MIPAVASESSDAAWRRLCEIFRQIDVKGGRRLGAGDRPSDGYHAVLCPGKGDGPHPVPRPLLFYTETIDGTPFYRLALRLSRECPEKLTEAYPPSLLRVAYALLTALEEAAFSALFHGLYPLLCSEDGDGRWLRADWTPRSSFLAFPDHAAMTGTLQQAADLFTGRPSRMIFPDFPWLCSVIAPLALFHAVPGARRLCRALFRRKNRPVRQAQAGFAFSMGWAAFRACVSGASFPTNADGGTATAAPRLPLALDLFGFSVQFANVLPHPAKFLLQIRGPIPQKSPLVHRGRTSAHSRVIAVSHLSNRGGAAASEAVSAAETLSPAKATPARMAKATPRWNTVFRRSASAAARAAARHRSPAHWTRPVACWHIVPPVFCRPAEIIDLCRYDYSIVNIICQ